MMKEHEAEIAALLANVLSDEQLFAIRFEIV